MFQKTKCVKEIKFGRQKNYTTSKMQLLKIPTDKSLLMILCKFCQLVFQKFALLNVYNSFDGDFVYRLGEIFYSILQFLYTLCKQIDLIYAFFIISD